MASAVNNPHSGIVPDLGEFTPKNGTIYRPSNGTEGQCFEERWCYHCKNDKAYRDGGYQNGSLGCSILANVLAGNVDHPDYPKEWQWQSGKPVCTAFDDETLNITNEERAAQLPLL